MKISDKMCLKVLILFLFTISTTSTQNLIGVKVHSGEKRYCLPPPPQNGTTYYTITKAVPHPTIENAYTSFELEYPCIPILLLGNMGYNYNIVLCKNGDWVYNFPDCDRSSEDYWDGYVPRDCRVPRDPFGGSYSIAGKPDAVRGEVFDSLYLTLTCKYRYRYANDRNAFCIDNKWSVKFMPTCEHVSEGCELRMHPSMQYNCRNKTHSYACTNEVPHGTTVELQCKPDFEDPNAWRVPSMTCSGGRWRVEAVCTPTNGNGTCELHKHPAVEYRCPIENQNFRVCDDVEPAGTKIIILCKLEFPAQGASSAHFFCVDTNWVHVSSCWPSAKKNNAECGIPSGNHPLIFGGNIAARGEVPWHTAVYMKTETPYLLICGGSLISNSLIISAAHCFWDDLEKLLPASNFAITVGNLYRTWNDSRDDNVQLADVSRIIIPALFGGNSLNYQEDIAIVRVVPQFDFGTYVRPVCLDFEFEFEKKQLRKGNTGTIAGWGLTAGGTGGSQVLRIVQMPYVPQVDCIKQSSPSFAAYVTGDKICAGTNGTAVCRGDSGGGLVFREIKNGIPRYYLRGVVSTAPNSGEECDGSTLAAFTSVNKHQHFLREYL